VRPGAFAAEARAAVAAAASPLDRSTRMPSRRETAIAVLALGVVTVLLYGPHVVRGGWYYDDWSWFAELEQAHDGGFFSLLERGFSFAEGYRPVNGVIMALLHALAGESSWVTLAVGVVIVGLSAVGLWLVLRLTGLRPVVAMSAALLFVALPAADATRLWTAALPATAALTLVFAGMALGLTGLGAESARRRRALHGGALVLYALAAFTYELILPLIGLAGVLYWGVAGRRAALPRWAADIAACGVCVLLISGPAQRFRGGDSSLSLLVDRARETLSAGGDVFMLALPFDQALEGPAGILLVLAAAFGAGLLAASGGAQSRMLRDWVIVTCGSLVFALAGLLLLLPSVSYYIPRWTGIANRFGLASSPGAALLIVCLIFLVALCLLRIVRSPRFAPMAATALVLVTAVLLARQERAAQDGWADAARATDHVLAALDTALPEPLPARSVVVTFRHSTSIQPVGVPVFESSWDLQGALRLRYDDETVDGRPWPGIRCLPDGIVFPPDFAPPESTKIGTRYRYGRVWFVDVEHRQATRIGNLGSCDRTVRTLLGT